MNGHWKRHLAEVNRNIAVLLSKKKSGTYAYIWFSSVYFSSQTYFKAFLMQLAKFLLNAFLQSLWGAAHLLPDVLHSVQKTKVFPASPSLQPTVHCQHPAFLAVFWPSAGRGDENTTCASSFFHFVSQSLIVSPEILPRLLLAVSFVPAWKMVTAFAESQQPRHHVLDTWSKKATPRQHIWSSYQILVSDPLSRIPTLHTVSSLGWSLHSESLSLGCESS